MRGAPGRTTGVAPPVPFGASPSNHGSDGSQGGQNDVGAGVGAGAGAGAGEKAEEGVKNDADRDTDWKGEHTTEEVVPPR